MTSVFWTTVGRFLAREKAPVHRAPTWRGRLLRALALLFLALGVYGAYQAPRTEALQVQRVTVQGTDRLSPEEIRATSGLLGVSLWRVRAGEV